MTPDTPRSPRERPLLKTSNFRRRREGRFAPSHDLRMIGVLAVIVIPFYYYLMKFLVIGTL